MDVGKKSVQTSTEGSQQKPSCPSSYVIPVRSLQDGTLKSETHLGIETPMTSKLVQFGNWSKAEVVWPTDSLPPASVEISWIETKCHHAGLCDCTFMSAVGAVEP